MVCDAHQKRHRHPAALRPSAALQADTGGRGVVALCGPTGRGALVMGSSDGYLTLLDPRSGYKAEQVGRP